MARNTRRHSTVAPQKAGTHGPRWYWATLPFAVLAAAALYWWMRPMSSVIRRSGDRNVLLVTIDTLRADALATSGGRASTPNLDRLAAQGARFTFAHSHSVLTLPSHATILTGRYPYQHGVRNNAGYRVSQAEPTLATCLKALGFSTGAFIGGFPLERRFGLTSGFDTYDDRIGESGTDITFSENERRADAVVGSAVNWIGHQSGKWLAWVHLYDPHAPYRPPDEWLARYRNEPYLGEVAWTDFTLGPLLDRLTAQSRPTLVVVTADHGEALGEHDELTHGVFAYESTLHVPLIVTEIDPARRDSPRGVVVASPVRHIDVLPTVLDALGRGADASLPGRSLMPAISSHGDADRSSYFESLAPALERGWAPLRGVISGNEKYIDLPIPELYDLAADPGEQHNLAPDRRDRVQVLANLLHQFDTGPVVLPQIESAATVERLRALGYISSTAAPARRNYTDADDPKRLIARDRKLQQAIEAVQAGRTAEAIGVLQDLIAQRPDDAEAYIDLSVAYWQTDDRDRAIDTLKAAVKRGLPQRELRVKLGTCLSLAGRGADAVKILEGLAPDDPDAENALGLAYAQLGRTADALRTFRHVLEIDPASGLALENIATVQRKMGDRAGEEQSLRRAIAIDPTLAGAHTALGILLMETNRAAAAIQEWMEAVKLDPSNLGALYDLTVALGASGRVSEARSYGERFLQVAPASMRQQIERVRQLVAR
jgi:arylsulfatase A-like enzyme/Flp pilus assembly protein TadD